LPVELTLTTGKIAPASYQIVILAQNNNIVMKDSMIVNIIPPDASLKIICKPRWRVQVYEEEADKGECEITAHNLCGHLSFRCMIRKSCELSCWPDNYLSICDEKKSIILGIAVDHYMCWPPEGINPLLITVSGYEGGVSDIFEGQVIVKY